MSSLLSYNPPASCHSIFNFKIIHAKTDSWDEISDGSWWCSVCPETQGLRKKFVDFEWTLYCTTPNKRKLNDDGKRAESECPYSFLWTAKTWAAPVMKAKVKRDGTSRECTKWGVCSWWERLGVGRVFESTWWSLFFTPMFIFILFLCISCIFIPKDEHLKLRKLVHECEGNRETVLVPLFITVHDGPLYGVKVAAVEMIVLSMADRYCYQSFFKIFFIHFSSSLKL